MVNTRAQVSNTPREPLDPEQIPYLAADLDRLLAVILEAAQKLVASDGAAAAVLGNQGLHVLASDGPTAASLGSTCRLLQLGAAGRALQAGMPVLVADTAADSSWKGMPGQEQARSWLAVPLASGGQTIGVLTWTALVPNRFGDEALVSASRFAEMTAPIVRWAQLVDSVRRHVGLRAGSRGNAAGGGGGPEAQLAQLTRSAHELAGARDAFIYLVERETGMLRCAAAVGYHEQSLGNVGLRNDGSLSAWIAAPPPAPGRHEPGHSDREVLEGLGFKDTLLLPLLVDGKPVGFLGVADRRDGAPFGEYGTRLLTELACGASLAVAQIGSRVAHPAAVDYGSLLPASSVPVGVLTPEGLLRFANPALSQLVARPGQALYDRYLSEFMGVDDSRRFGTALGQVVVTGQSRMMELRLGLRGRRRSMQLSLAALHSLLGNGGRVLAVFDDAEGAVSQDDEHGVLVKELQERIAALADVDRLRSRFVSDVSHELRTPLAVIKLHATLARIGRPERQTYYLQTIEQETHRLEMMVENVLDMARMERQGLQVRPEWFEPEETIARVLEAYAETGRQKGISLTSTVSGPLPRLWADKNHTVQILTNLLDNALKYTSQGGRVWVEAHTNPTGSPPGLEISVGDTGLGIREDEQDRVFERFYRGSNNPPGATGTGLGLAIIRELMSALGGTVTLVSSPGQGSVFTLHFPLPTGGPPVAPAQRDPDSLG